jgi:phosphoribosylamine--glycine ligase
MLQGNAFGVAGQTVVVEEFLHGEEVSVLIITDGTRAVPLPPAQDHKRALDDDRGKNTGGMGAYTPAPMVDDALLNRIHREIIEPTLAGMRAEGSPYRGCLYCGLMVSDSGPKVLEYNCRFGDPEAQVVVPLLEGDLAQLLRSAARGVLDESAYVLRDGSAVCVVLASGGYPDEHATGKRISGLDSLPPGVVAFHAGTKRSGNDILTAGGRVLGITAISDGKDLASTIEIAYDAVGMIAFEGMQYRRDIGRKALRRLRAPSTQ